jgi:hypothetical protein
MAAKLAVPKREVRRFFKYNFGSSQWQLQFVVEAKWAWGLSGGTLSFSDTL